ncbi:hypothetical protein AB1Y20_022018 [Prymnesium parvum]|uniref:Chromo domain-containing protein n=1 Tax=Prymnesium parvum TaxID=97485 RepID=A0AB34JHR0_PRYPA
MAPNVMAVDALIEVEVAAADGSVCWKPSRVTSTLDGGRFVACVNGEPDFLEQFGAEEEGTEWRWPAEEDIDALSAAYDKAREAASAQPDTYRVETILARKRLPASQGHKEVFLVKWVNFSEDFNTWEPREHLVGCADLLQAFEAEQRGAPGEARGRKRRSGRPPAAAREEAADETEEEEAAEPADSVSGSEDEADDGEFELEHNSTSEEEDSLGDFDEEDSDAEVRRVKVKKLGAKPRRQREQLLRSAAEAAAAGERAHEEEQSVMPHLMPHEGYIAVEPSAAAGQPREGLNLRVLHRELDGRAGRAPRGEREGRESHATLPLPSLASAWLDATRAHQLCNAGAPVWALDWLPSAAGEEEYLAVGTHTQAATCEPRAGTNGIQIWRVRPRAEAEAWVELLHRGGGVLDLCWCPSGNACAPPPAADSPPPPLPRLGLLSAACADGNGAARIWLAPVVQLQPPLPLLTLRLSWCPTPPHTLLAAATDNGSVFLWDVSTPEVAQPAEESCSAESGDAPNGSPLATHAVPAYVCGPNTRGGGGRFDHSFLEGSSFRSCHSAPVRGLRWSPPPLQILASVGQDGMLMVWDYRSCWAPIQQHLVARQWLLDVEWSLCTPSLVTCGDSGKLFAVRLEADGIVAPISEQCEKQLRASVDTIPATLALPPANEATSIWATGPDTGSEAINACGLSRGGDVLACVTSDGQLTLWQEVAGGLSVHVDILRLAEPAERDEGFHLDVCTGAYANSKSKQAKGKKFVRSIVSTPRESLRCIRWNPNPARTDWMACAGHAGVVVILEATAELKSARSRK